MLFNSSHFLIFFPIVVIFYFFLPQKHRNLLLLIASWYFYMSWKAEYIILIIISTSIDYLAALKIHKSNKQKLRRNLLIFSLIANIGILFAFKYFNFFSSILTDLLPQSFDLNKFSTLNILLPVGISFYTFQSMSYTIDVYRKRILPEHNFINFALYVSFFPQLVAGPIERAGNLLPQFKKKFVFEYSRISYGLKLMFWGFFQKIVIADNIARFVDAVYNNPESYFGWDILLVTLLFAIQIYADFSGYTDIARGAAKIMGYNLMINFKRPYFATSFRNFWQRWHISLSSWFKDYVYISIGGNRLIQLNWIGAIFLTFVLSGLWHGAKWTFVLWGVYHATLYLIEYKLNIKFPMIRLSNNNLLKGIKIMMVFFLTVYGWMLFRANSLNDFITLQDHLFSKSLYSVHFSFDRPSMLVNLLSFVILLAVWIIERNEDIVNYISKKNIWERWFIYYLIGLWLIGFGNWGLQPFIYFQF